MITQAKYEKIDHEFVKVVSALNHAKIKELCDKGTIQLSLFDKENIVEIVDGNMRYMLCLNPEMAAKETMTRATLLAKTKEALDKIISSNRKTKNPKGVRAGKVVNKYKMSKFIIFEGNDDSLTYRVDEEKIKQEAALDGCYIVFTDASKDDLSTTETVKTYKSLIQVEQAFRNLKTATLEVRPIYHKTDERIKCHVFICMLSYYIMWHMKQRLEPLNKLDNRGKNRLYSFDYIIETLKSVNSNTVEFMDVQSTKITTPNEEQRQFLKLLGVAL
jgi:transposase